MSRGAKRRIAPNSWRADGHHCARLPRNSCVQAKNALGTGSPHGLVGPLHRFARASPGRSGRASGPGAAPCLPRSEPLA
eukprot:8384158-Alexandrium_andersonii.AAC.1